VGIWRNLIDNNKKKDEKKNATATGGYEATGIYGADMSG